jgi:hypothetical protein
MRWGAADDIEHLARRGLIFKRLLQLARTRLNLLEEPGVLNGDHRLICERLEKLNLLL